MVDSAGVKLSHKPVEKICWWVWKTALVLMLVGVELGAFRAHQRGDKGTERSALYIILRFYFRI